MFNIFKKKREELNGLERALEENLITQEEYYKLKMERLEIKLKDYNDQKKVKKGKKR